MPKFLIVSSPSELSPSSEIEKVFDANSLEEAEEIAAEYLTGDGLPCSGPTATYRLFEISEVEGFVCTTEKLWKAHMMRLALFDPPNQE